LTHKNPTHTLIFHLHLSERSTKIDTEYFNKAMQCIINTVFNNPSISSNLHTPNYRRSQDTWKIHQNSVSAHTVDQVIDTAAKILVYEAATDERSIPDHPTDEASDVAVKTLAIQGGLRH